MLLFKQIYRPSRFFLLVSQSFCLSALIFHAWISWQVGKQTETWPQTQDHPVQTHLKNLNLARVMHNLLRIVEFMPAQIKIQKLIFLADEFRLIGVSAKTEVFTGFCERLRTVVGLHQFQILNWQAQVVRSKKVYHFVLVWR